MPTSRNGGCRTSDWKPMDQNDQSETEVAAAILARMTEIGLDEDAATARDVVQQFIETITAYREAALEAHQAGDAPALATAAHKLAGIALTLGADELGRKASRIETDIQAGRDATVAVQLSDLTAASHRVISASNTILSGLPNPD